MSRIVDIDHFKRLTFLLLISATSLIAKMEANDKSGKSQEKTEFFLHPQKLDALFHRAATMALLKAKARETLEAVPSQLERIVFGECVKDGGKESPAKYAACLVKLFRARDIGKKPENDEKEAIELGTAGAEQGIFGETMNLLKNLANEIAPKTQQNLTAKIDNEVTSKKNNFNAEIKPKITNFTIVPNSGENVQKQRIPKKKKGKKKKMKRRNRWKKKWTTMGKKSSTGKKKKMKPQFWTTKRRRIRRELDPKLRRNLRMPKSIGALKVLQKYLDRLEWAQTYLRTMSQDSAKALKPFLAQPIRFVQSSSSSAVLPLLSQIQSILNATSNRPDLSFSLLSPRLLSLFPATKSKPKLLSPDLFSFNRDGLLSLPQLFGMISRDESESLEWLDFMLELTGAGKQLAALLEKMRPEMEEFEQRIWPAIERLREQEKLWGMLKASLGAEQKKQLAQRGYVQLEKWQQEIIFGKKEADQMEEERLGLEAKIEQLAKLAHMKTEEKPTIPNRVRRENNHVEEENMKENKVSIKMRIRRDSNEAESRETNKSEEKVDEAKKEEKVEEDGSNEENNVNNEKGEEEENKKKEGDEKGAENVGIGDEERKRRLAAHEVSNVVERENDNIVRVTHHERDGIGGITGIGGIGGIGPYRPLGGPLIGPTAGGIYPPNAINPIGGIGGIGGIGVNPPAAAAMFPNNPLHNNLLQNNLLYRNNLLNNGLLYPHGHNLLYPNGLYPNGFNNPLLYPNGFNHWGHRNPFFNPIMLHNRLMPCHSPGSCVIGGQETNLLHPIPHRRFPQNVPGGKSPDTMDSILMAPRTVLLTPWAFEQRLGGVILEGVYLSPHAFSSELVSPEVLTAKVASPSAFMAAILSPMALTARIVSPSAFRSQILSPEALSAYVLNPDVFLAEILSPNVMQARVLSPKALFVQILNPMIASPRIGSPQVGGLVVLSPNFLSPRIYSQESLMVEVLSPHILGGEHEVIEADHWMPDGSTHYVGFPGQIQGPLDLQHPNWG